MLSITNQMPDTINDGERVIRLLSPSNEEYVVTELDGDELEEEIRLALRRAHGKGYRYMGFEDVTYVLETAERARKDAELVWQGAGWYAICWSDGDMSGSRQYEAQDELVGDLESAWLEATRAHRPIALACQCQL